ncbi:MULTISPECIES: MlaD family protein [unclassified Paracoccus (in: a-proteobacteria)]|uniref:MlaD family protein n=1 Tax=unclassified Paracoccus (in: a-proteobacteria) TaxID=2688777 RepID=UPI0012B187E6|nr:MULTISPECIES: MlaD family protein [unclassified Paracoccus (in: a-proteobacteria)]UXU75620.1 MlaD family protein [Paracoccus sp. SMMA_5]UXU81525.1 MlaD family protein [Paracoccus sp. SMMA_5_TC]
METKANYVLIGAFTIAGFLGLLLFLMWFAKLELDRRYAYYDIYFPEVSGLGVSSGVTFAGLSVGKVVDMQLSSGPNGAVRVRVELAEDTPVRTDSRASIEIQGVTGVANVAITAGSPGAPLLRQAQADGVPVIAANRSALQTLSDQGPEMISRLNTVAEQMTELLGAENQTRVRNILGNVERSSANLDKALADVTKATDSIAAAAADISAFGTKLDSLGAAAEVTLGHADTALTKFTDTAGKADATLQAGTEALAGLRDYVASDLKGLTQRLDQTAASLQADLTRLTDRADTSLDSLDQALAIGTRTLAAAERTFDGADRVINSNVEPVVADLRVTLGKANQAIDRVVADLPQITGRLREAADSANAAFASLRGMLDSARGPVQAFTREGLPQFTRMASDLRGLVANVNQLVSALRRNPSQILSGPKTPEFRR